MVDAQQALGGEEAGDLLGAPDEAQVALDQLPRLGRDALVAA
jgi:hypothetical protein